MTALDTAQSIDDMDIPEFKLRPEFDKPKWGIENVFEDGSGIGAWPWHAFCQN